MWKLESQHVVQMISEQTNVFQAIALQEKNKWIEEGFSEEYSSNRIERAKKYGSLLLKNCIVS